MDNDEIMVSVICVTYNHVPYIRKALDSILNQKTSFRYEIIVHDDASTDGTADIIREYQERYPDVIKPILQSENQYSKGVVLATTYLAPVVRGRYIAFCEGDDYWCDSSKLQRQVDVLERHTEVDMCSHSAYMVDAVTEEQLGILGPHDNREGIIPVERVIYGGGGYVATNSSMYRSSIYLNPMEFRKFWIIDYSLQIQGSLKGGMYYIPEEMSVCRRNVPGSWTARLMADNSNRVNHYKKIIKLLEKVDEETGGAYSTIIQETILNNEFEYLYIEKQYKVLLNKKYRDVLKHTPLKRKVKIIVLSVFCSK